MYNIWASSSDGGNKKTMDITLEQMRVRFNAGFLQLCLGFRIIFLEDS